MDWNLDSIKSMKLSSSARLTATVIMIGHGTVVHAAMSWSPVYATDFATDPGWIVGGQGYFNYSPGDLAYVAPYQNFYAVTPVTLAPQQSFKAECDIYLQRLDWAANMTFGLYGPTIEGFDHYGPRPYVRINFGRGDHGQSIVLEGYDSSGMLRQAFMEPAPWTLDTWYHEEIIFDHETETLSASVTRMSDNFLLWSDSISGVQDFSDLVYLGVSDCGINDPYFRLASAAIDNVALSQPVPEPSTFIAGSLLALPFSLQVIRHLRICKRGS